MADVRDTGHVTTSTQVTGHNVHTGESTGDADDTHKHRHQRHDDFIDEVKNKYYEAYRKENTDQEPISEIDTSFKVQLLKTAGHFVAYSNLESRNKHLSNFASDDDVTNQLDLIIDRLHRSLRTHFRIPGYIELVGSCVDDSKVGRITEIDSLFVLNENFEFEGNEEENTYELSSADGIPHDPSVLIDEFASAIEKCMEESLSKSPNTVMQHGGFNAPHFSGVRYNGPAVTILLTYPEDVSHLEHRGSKQVGGLTETFQHLEAKRLNVSIDVTLAFKLSANSDIVSKIRSKVDKIQDVLYRKMITKTDVHFIPRREHDTWCLTTSRLEAQLLSCLSAESYVKQAYCYAKLLNENFVFPQSCKTEFQELISQKLFALESVSISNRVQIVKDWQKMMRYTHSFLSDSDAKKYNEDTKRDMPLKNAALKHMLLKEALQSPSLFKETAIQAEPFDLVLKVLRSIGKMRKCHVSNAFIDEAKISVYSLTKSAMLSEEKEQLKHHTKQLCMETCKVFEEKEDNEELRYIRSQLLISASEFGHIHMVNKLLKFKGTDVNAESGDGSSALYEACLGGFVEVAQTLHENGAELNPTKRLPLNAAALRGHRRLMKWLLDEGADVNAVDKDEFTALSLGCEKGFLDLAQDLLNRGAKVNHGGRLPLGRAALGGHKAVVEWLAKNGADINATDQDGCTALCLSCERGFLELAQYLHSRGANVKNHAGQLPLGRAAFGGHKSVVEWLVENEADVNAVDKEGWTALTLVCEKGFLELAQYLHSRGANVSQGGELPLGRAALGGYTAVVEWLVETGIDVNAMNHLGLTALYYSCQNGYLEVARQLVTHGADIDRGNSTPLMGAALGGHLDTVQWLIEQGADTSLKNASGQDALQSVRNKKEQLGDDVAALKFRNKLFEVEKMLKITRK